MPKILYITFRNSQGTSAAAQQAAWERAHQIAVWPGLIWKIWIADAAQSLYGGVYLFEDEASATAYINGAIADAIRSLPGVAEFQTQLLDVNPSLTAITRGPLQL